MYGRDFFARADWQLICEFLSFGPSAPYAYEKGTLEERVKKHDHDFIRSLEVYRDDILATNWSALSREEAYWQTETLSQAVLQKAALLQDTSFEAGVMAGFLLGLQIGGKKPCQ